MFIFSSIAFRFESPDTADLKLLSFIRRYFPESFRAESIRLGTLAAYDRNFGQLLSNDPSALRRFQKPPLPFAFKIPRPRVGAVADSRRELVLSIAGSAVNDIDCYIGAVQRVFAAIQVESGIDVKILQTATIAADGTTIDIGKNNRDVSLISGDDILPLVWSATRVELDFISPLRLMRDGAALHRLTFADYIRPLMRRISSLAYYYCGIEYDLDFQGLAVGSRKVKTDDLSLVWTKGAGSASGIQGQVRFSGDLHEYQRFMALGERFNLGKGAAYGMGAYLVSTVDCQASK